MRTKQIGFYNCVGYWTKIRYNRVVENMPHASANWAICMKPDGTAICYSYGTIIGEWDGSPTGVWLNPIKYSRTSSRHMSWWKRYLLDMGWDGHNVLPWEERPIVD